MDFWWKLVMAGVFVLVAIALVPLPKTKKVKTKKFYLNVLLAALSYFGLLVILPLIYFNFHRNDRFLLFHLKQGIAIFVLLLISVLTAKFVESVGIIMFISFGIIAIFAMVQASRGYYWRLPLIGKLIQ